MTSDWYLGGLDDDMRPHLFALADRGKTCALATLVASQGGPRPVGSQMLVTAADAWGYLSGGCIEADVELHAREVLSDGRVQRLVYGEGSPFLDLRLPCGGRLELVVERVSPDDPRVAALLRGHDERSVAQWLVETGEVVTFDPPFRLVVIGGDPFAMAIAASGIALGWAVTLNLPFGPDAPPPLPCAYSRAPSQRLLAEQAPDPWTAIAVATHDLDLDNDALLAALSTRAGYVGVLGARRRLPERLQRLREAGLGEDALQRLRAPLGLAIAAATPRETAVATLAEIIAVFRNGDAVRATCRA